MIMKTQINLTTFALLVPLFAMFFSSCDKIDEPVIVVSVSDIPDKIPDTLFYADSVFVTRKQVLLEEFTGHKCVNCPTASLNIHDVATAYDHQLIIYNIHEDHWALPDSTGLYTMDFRSPPGKEIFDYFQVLANPMATVNRVSFNNFLVLPPQHWENAFLQQLEKPDMIEIKLKNSWFPNLEKILIEVEVRFLSEAGGKFKIVVIIVEDNIISPQKNNNNSIGDVPDWLDYDHRNVLRDAITPTFGSDLTNDGTVMAGEVYSSGYFYSPDSTWVIANCNIIAYVYHEESLEVLQVAELSVRTED
jgi:hypothetical protein